MFQHCPACGEDVIFVTEAVYDGFRKTGETHRCTACGHVLRDAAPAKKPLKKKGDSAWAAFSSEDEAKPLNLFDVEAETGRLCRKCAHYVVHPFTQRCSLHDIEVSATDTCDQFEAKEKET
ncbi:MAG: hypothetical protein JJU29_11885 [Verrucomicrobia bacterium]|nr:hypothetical protein [Verrucomicrobiota bacterium]MCH8514146.1 hypothetical protein [Kiritimatiellia bacterium]